MSGTWQKSYEELKGYIAENPNIEISMTAICLPADVRPGFYKLFDAVRVGFVEDNFPASLEKAYALSRNFAEIGQSIRSSLNLQDIEISQAGLNWFIQDPLNGLMRGLFDPLFGLLSRKMDLATFEQVATRSVDDEFRDFFGEGYRRWVELALVKLMSPDKNYLVPVKAYNSDPPEHAEEMRAPGICVESVPDAVESNKIYLEQSPLYSFIVPKLLVHSARLACYAALHCDFTKAHWTARTISDNREWYEIAAIKEAFRPTGLWPGMTLYTSQKLHDLVLIADHSRVVRPDMIVEIMEDGDWYDKGRLKLVKHHHHILKPRLGTYVVCREPVPEAAINELEPGPVPTASPVEGAAPKQPIEAAQAMPAPEPPPDIHLLSVGYHLSQLEPIMLSLLKPQEKAKSEASIVQ